MKDEKLRRKLFFLEQKKRNVILKPIILYNDQMLMKFKRNVLVRRGAGEGEERLARKQSLPIITDKMDHTCPVSCWTYSTWL